MTTKEVSDIYTKINQYLNSDKISQALILMNTLSNTLNDYNLSVKLEEKAVMYRNMLNYKLSDIQSDNENKIYNQFVNDLFYIASDLKDNLFVRFSNRHEYYLLRTLPTLKNYAPEGFNNFDKIPFLLQSHYLTNSLGAKEKSMLTPEQWNEIVIKHQQICSYLYNYIWLNRLTDNELEKTITILNDKTIGTDIKSIIVSALTLNILRLYDSKKLLILLSLWDNDDIMVKMRALTGVVLVLARYSQRMNFDKDIVSKIKLRCDDSAFLDLMESILFQLIKATETEKLTRYIKEDIMPDMLKISPHLKAHLSEMDIDVDKEEITPKIENFFEKNGMTEKLQEFGEMQMDGLDVYVSTFAQMKNFAFFNAVENWFLPFDKENPHISKLFEEKETLFSLIVSNPSLCNSDKYSLSLGLLQMADKEIKIMEVAIKEEKVQLDEILKEAKSLCSNYDEKTISNQYIQDLYRFYKFFPKHNEFDNPLVEITQIIDNNIFNVIFSTAKQKNKIAEYFYTYNHFSQANALFLDNFNSKKPQLEICRKIGYCYQQSADYQNAVNYYLIAEGLEKNNNWVLRRMAFCYRKLDNMPAAIDCYKTLLNNSKEDFKLIFRLAMCYLEIKDFEQALKLFYQIEYLKPDYPKIKNMLMWASLQCGKLQQAKEFTEKVLDDLPNANDLVTAGHIFLALNDNQTAFLHYRSALTQIQNIDEFVQIFETDKPALLQLGIKEAHINYMRENVLINVLG